MATATAACPAETPASPGGTLLWMRGFFALELTTSTIAPVIIRFKATPPENKFFLAKLFYLSSK